MNKNKKFRTLSCLVAGCLILTGAVFANVDNANGYTNYKNAIKKIMKASNYTVDAKITAYIDDVLIAETDFDAKLENGSVLSSNTNIKMIDDEKYNEAELVVDTEQSYYRDRNVDIRLLDISHPKSEMKARRYEIFIDNEYEEKNDKEIYYPITGSSVDAEVVDKAILFAETASDSFVGEMKNNFVYLGEENGERHYNVTLAKEQMPNIITSGFSLFCGVMHAGFEDYEEYSKPGEDPSDYNNLEDIAAMIFLNEKEPFIKSAVCDFKIDEYGNLTYNHISGTVGGYTADGEEHTLNLNIELNIRDIEATTADTFDVYGLMGDVEMKDGTTVSFKELCEKANSIYAIDGNNSILVQNCNVIVKDKPLGQVYVIDGKEVTNNDYNEVYNKLVCIYDTPEETEIIIDEPEETEIIIDELEETEIIIDEPEETEMIIDEDEMLKTKPTDF